jgi:hypothetical protein
MFEETVTTQTKTEPRFAVQPLGPEKPVVDQLAAYNARDIDTFCACYAENVIIQDLGSPPHLHGRTGLRARYEDLFKNAPNLKCTVDRRLVVGNTVIDDELLTGHPRGDNINVVAIYQVNAGLIQQVWFVTDTKPPNQ